MKKFIVAGLMLTSMSVFSQSYLILSNGITLTTDNVGYIYDFGHFRLPYKISVAGGQFLVADQKLSTVDSSGFLYEKLMKVEKIKGKGLNYFINDKDHLVTIDTNGFYYEFDKEDKVFKKTIGFGGNFFLVKPENRKPLIDLYTVNSTGNYIKISLDELNPADITKIGGTYFQTMSGVIYTVSKDGFVFAKTEVKVSDIKISGGNFLIDSESRIFTVSEDGFLTSPVTPVNFKASEIQQVGANYMIDSEGRIFLVDKTGTLVERTISHDLKNTKILSF